MGTDLTLVPERYPSLDDWLCLERLQLNMRDYDLWDRLREQATPLGKPIEWLGEDGVERLEVDYDGDPISYLPAGILAREFAKLPPEEVCWWDKAVLALIAALPPSTRVLLWFG